MEIKELVGKAHENAENKGFWEDWNIIGLLAESHINPRTLNMAENNLIGNRLMLITDEVAEAHEALRHNDKDNFKEELADVVIRVFDLCGGLEIDLESEILKKMEKNLSRPYKHGKEF